MGIIHWENWDEEELRTLIKELYEKKGYNVEIVHGRLEPGIDLIATNLDSAGKAVIEKLGIQASIPKADKGRAKDAAMALTKMGLNLSYFLIIAIKGQTEDFNASREQSELKGKFVFENGESLEKDLLANGILPEKELQRLEEEFYRSEAFKILEDTTGVIYEKGYLPILDFDSALKELDESKDAIMDNLRLLLRGLQETSDISGRIFLSMSEAVSYNHLDVFVDEFVKGQSLVLKSLKKVRSAIASLESIPAALKLLFGSLSTSERAVLMRAKQKTRLFWIFFYFDPEAISKHGYRTVLLQVFCGLQDRMNEIKTRVDNMINLLQDEDETTKHFRSTVSRFPEKNDNADSKDL